MASYAVHYAETAEVIMRGEAVEKYDLRHNVACGAGAFFAVLASPNAAHVDCGRCIKGRGFPKVEDIA